MNAFKTTVCTSAGFGRFDVSISRSSRSHYGKRNGWMLVDRGGWKPKVYKGLSANEVRAFFTSIS